jgi:hypothetical protein
MLFHSINDDGTKFDPVRVIVIAELPTEAEAGLIEIREGAGFEVDEPITKLSAVEVPPPGVGFMTVTEAVPAF